MRQLSTRARTASIATAVMMSVPASVYADAERVVRTNEQIPWAATFFVPCANGGAGETVDVTGTLRIADSVHFDANGGVHSRFQINAQNASGEGQVTGDAYRVQGPLHIVNNDAPGEQREFNMIDQVRLVSAGSGSDFHVTFSFRKVINADGTTTTERRDLSIRCG